jgi:isoleucyl-tRNA synthetase
LWNSYAFFATYASLDRFDPHAAESQIPLAQRTVLDRWIISRLHQLVAEVRDSLDSYAPDRAARAIERFTIDELSNWYIRRNRRRFWKSENDGDKAAAYQTLYESLTTLAQLLAPFTPFLAEAIYQNLVRSVDPDAPESVHLTDFPRSHSNHIDESLARDMDAVLEVVGAGHAARQEAAIKVRQPLPALLIHAREPAMLESVLRLQDQVLDELNVKSLQPMEDPGQYVSYTIRPNLPALGPRLGKQVNAVREALGALDAGAVVSLVRTGRDIHLDTPEGNVTLQPSDVIVDSVRLPGYAAAQGPRSTVVLDTTLTPALIEEGLARDFVRGIQDARKQAGYQIDDTIEIRFIADPEVSRAIEVHRDYVMTETLATTLEGELATGASDAVELEAVEGPGGARLSDGRYVDQILVGNHQMRVELRANRNSVK